MLHVFLAKNADLMCFGRKTGLSEVNDWYIEKVKCNNSNFYRYKYIEIATGMCIHFVILINKKKIEHEL